MLLSQYRRPDGRVQVVARDGTEAYEVDTAEALYDLAKACVKTGKTLKSHVLDLGLGQAVDLPRLCADGRMLPPVLHPDPSHLHVTGTGLTHLGSASNPNSWSPASASPDTFTSARP